MHTITPNIATEFPDSLDLDNSQRSEYHVFDNNRFNIHVNNQSKYHDLFDNEYAYASSTATSTRDHDKYDHNNNFQLNNDIDSIYNTTNNFDLHIYYNSHYYTNVSAYYDSNNCFN